METVERSVRWRARGLVQPVSVWFLVCALGATVMLTQRFAGAQEPALVTFDHSGWDRMLKRYVDENGRVAYKQLGRQGRAKLDAYLDRLAEAEPDNMRRADRLAFWINAYNAGIVAGILRGYSPESALSRAQLLRWYTIRVAGKDRSPHEIEHEILRKEFREPRIHFALVCGATSCPKLRREAYRGDVIDQQLDDQARRFINDPLRNHLDPVTEVRLSSLFKWFESDFVAAGGSVGDFAARYVDDPRQAEELRLRQDRFEFLDYDWTLNAQTDQ